MRITQEDVDYFQDQWYEYAHEGSNVFKIKVATIPLFINALDGTLALYCQFDVHWENRLMLELANNTKKELKQDDWITFHELLHTLCALRFGKGCMSYVHY